MRVRWLLVLALVLFAACSTDGDEAGRGDGEEPEVEFETEDDPTGGGSLDRATACGEFLTVITDFTLDDDQSAAALNALASRTTDSELADAIRGVADAFARHDPEIYSTEVDDLCQ